MAVEGPRRRELAELVAYHFLVDRYRHMLLAIVDAEHQADELRQNGRAAAPDLDHIMTAGRARGICLLEQRAFDERAFPDFTNHVLRSLLLPLVAADENESIGRFVRAGLLAFGRLAPGCHRMTTAGGAAFAAAMRMVDRVHRDTAIMRLAAEPPVAAGLADGDVHVIRVGNRTDGAGAAAVNQTLLSRIQTHDDVVLVTTDELRVGAGGTSELAALADLQFDIVNDGADRHVAERHDIARLHVDVVAGSHGVADREPLRGQDIGLGAVGVLQKRNEGGTVRIVFQPLNGRRHIDLGALEIDDAIGLLVAAAAKPHAHAA